MDHPIEDEGTVKMIPADRLPDLQPKWDPLEPHDYPGQNRRRDPEPVRVGVVPAVVEKLTPAKWRDQGFEQALGEAERAYAHLVLAWEWYQGLERESADHWEPTIRKIGEFVGTIEKRREIG